MLWKDVLYDWKNGVIFKYPEKIKNRFQWKTSILKDDGNVEYTESFNINNKLPSQQNYSNFIEYIKNSNSKYVVAFPNKSKNTMLVIPMPVNNYNYATLKDFIDNAPKKQQIYFWKKVAKEFMKIHKSVVISVHGLGVHYTHVRISSKIKSK